MEDKKNETKKLDKKKSLTILLALFAVVCVFAVLSFSGVIDLSNISFTAEEETTDYAAQFVESVSDKIDYTGTSATPYLSTDIDNIFYTMSLDGDVVFYSYDNGAFTPVEATGTYSTTVTLSEQEVSAQITYLQQDGKICGYGLYMPEDGDYSLNTYAFFRLRSYGSDYSAAYSTSCLLLIDTTEDDFYSNDKVYEESFIFKYEDATASRALSEANRTIGMNGAKRSDYFVITDKVVDGSVDHQLFLSGRYYSESDETVDLFRSGGSGNNTDNIRLAQNVLGNWAEYTDDGIMYITTDDNDDVVIELLSESSGETTAVKTFENVKSNDIIVSGDYIFIISQNVVYSIEDDTQVSVVYSNSTFKADMFAVENDTVVLRGYIENEFPTMIIASAQTGEISFSCVNEMFRNIVNPVILNDGQVLVSAQSGSDFTYYIF